MAGEGDPEDLELDPPLPSEDEPEDLQDEALVEDEADEQSEPDEVDASKQLDGDRPPDQQARQPSRRDRRIEALTSSLADERRQREDLNRRLDAVLTGQTRQPQGESPEQRAQRLALLTPEERIREELNEAKHGFAQQMARMEFSSRDGADRAAFQAKATVDPFYKKWEPKVEAELTTLRNQGMNADREKVLFYLVGKAAIEGRSGAKQTARAQAQRRVQAQRTRPANSGSDVASSRRDRGSSLERRLENIEL